MELPSIEGYDDQFQLPTWRHLEWVSGMSVRDFLDQANWNVQIPKCRLHHSVKGWELSTFVHLSLLSDWRFYVTQLMETSWRVCPWTVSLNIPFLLKLLSSSFCHSNKKVYPWNIWEPWVPWLWSTAGLRLQQYQFSVRQSLLHCSEETGSHKRSREMPGSEGWRQADCAAHRHKRLSTKGAMQHRRIACNWI